MHLTAVQHYVVPDANIVSYLDRRLLIECMQYATILNIDIIANAYTIDIATQYGIEPHATAISKDYVPHDRRIGGKKTILTKYGAKASYSLYICHSLDRLSLMT